MFHTPPRTKLLWRWSVRRYVLTILQNQQQQFIAPSSVTSSAATYVQLLLVLVLYFRLTRLTALYKTQARYFNALNLFQCFIISMGLVRPAPFTSELCPESSGKVYVTPALFHGRLVLFHLIYVIAHACDIFV